MELRPYLNILRRRWWIVLALPVLVALASTVAALARPARYGVPMRLLITRDPSHPGAAGRTADGEDTTAQDVPAIVQSAAFRADLAHELARRGTPAEPADLAGAISATTSEHAVALTIADAQPYRAIAIAQALIEVLRANGLRYWGDLTATAGSTGLNVGVLDPPAQAVRLNGLRALGLEIGLRTLAGLGAGFGLAAVLDVYERRKG
jgi:hypothetical protein